MSTSYHPQSDGQTEIVNKWIEGYLRNYVVGQQRTWIKWLHLGEYCYKTTHHMTNIGMTPFRALYGYDASTFADQIFGDSRPPRPRNGFRRVKISLRYSGRTYRLLRISIRYMQTSIGLSAVLR